MRFTNQKVPSPQHLPLHPCWSAYPGPQFTVSSPKRKTCYYPLMENLGQATSHTNRTGVSHSQWVELTPHEGETHCGCSLCDLESVSFRLYVRRHTLRTFTLEYPRGMFFYWLEQQEIKTKINLIFNSKSLVSLIRLTCPQPSCCKLNSWSWCVAKTHSRRNVNSSLLVLTPDHVKNVKKKSYLFAI